ncbi:MAG: hypothetical protein L3J56_06895 [Bacteroidales bacterium]|nr:hypothetical protein [Bacteroidales bacterium]
MKQTDRQYTIPNNKKKIRYSCKMQNYKYELSSGGSSRDRKINNSFGISEYAMPKINIYFTSKY